MDAFPSERSRLRHEERFECLFDVVSVGEMLAIHLALEIRDELVIGWSEVWEV